MKRFFLLAAFLVAFSTTTNAQFQPSFAITAGLPTGDIDDQSSFALSADLYFMKSINSTLGLGVTTGYSIYFSEEATIGGITVDPPNTSYLPLAGAIRLNLTNDLSFGADLGYAFGLSDNVDGGFYYKPTVGFNIGSSSQLMLSYQGISEDGFNVNYIGLGFAFGL